VQLGTKNWISTRECRTLCLTGQFLCIFPCLQGNATSLLFRLFRAVLFSLTTWKGLLLWTCEQPSLALALSGGRTLRHCGVSVSMCKEHWAAIRPGLRMFVVGSEWTACTARWRNWGTTNR